MVINNRNNELEKTLSKLNFLTDEELEILQTTILSIKQAKKTKQEQIPCSIFNKKLSAFESIVKYLKEEEHLTYKKIGSILKRTTSTIGVTYKHAKTKQKTHFSNFNPPYINQNIFTKKMTVFESIIEELDKNFSVKEIAKITKRDYRTIWTVRKRAENKRAT